MNWESRCFFQRLNIVFSKADERVTNFTAPDLSAIKDKFVRKIQPLEFQTVLVKHTPEAIAKLKAWDREKKQEWKDYPSDVRGRIEVMIHRNASHLAWMLGGDNDSNPANPNEPIVVEVDTFIMDRALALAEYEVAVRFSHQPAVGNNEWALVENLIKKVTKERGQIGRQELYREIRADKFGIRTFGKAIDKLHQECLV